jgi:hypothetical protein
VNTDFSEEYSDETDNDTTVNIDEDKGTLTIDDLDDCSENTYEYYRESVGTSNGWPGVSIWVHKGDLKKIKIFIIQKRQKLLEVRYI